MPSKLVNYLDYKGVALLLLALSDLIIAVLCLIAFNTMDDTCAATIKIRLMVQSVVRVYFGISSALIGFTFLQKKEKNMGCYFIVFNWAFSLLVAANYLLAYFQMHNSCSEIAPFPQFIIDLIMVSSFGNILRMFLVCICSPIAIILILIQKKTMASPERNEEETSMRESQVAGFTIRAPTSKAEQLEILYASYRKVEYPYREGTFLS